MKSLFLLVLGALCGVLATVLFFTIDPTFDSSEADGAGGGNVTLSLSEEALAALIARELPQPAFGDAPQVQTTVGANGLVKVDIVVGGLGVGLRSGITLNPNIVDGKLKLEVVEANLGELDVPEEIAARIEAPIQARLDSLAAGLDYRLTAIRTTEHRLTFEIQI
ncbi:MAG: LmeA family phospholipid-binding protein [Dehalococcoidia bacterium]|jgi:uncharacterized protein YpmS